jgi:anti-sigma B factor antagonist
MSNHSDRRRRRARRPIAPRRGPLAQPRRATSLRPPRIEVHVEQHATLAVLRVAGEFDLCGVVRVEAALDRAIDSLTDQVVVDLRGVSFLDVSGLRTLVRADERARGESFAFRVVPPPGPGARIFSLTAAGRGLALLDAPPGSP